MKIILCLFSTLIMCEVQSSCFFDCFKKKKTKYTEVPQMGSDQNPLYNPYYQEPEKTTPTSTFISSLTTAGNQQEKKSGDNTPQKDASPRPSITVTNADNQSLNASPESNEPVIDVQELITALKAVEATQSSEEMASEATLHNSLTTGHHRSRSKIV